MAESFRRDGLAAMTPQETLAEFRQLCAEFAPLLEKTEAVFRRDREAYLAGFQERLRQLAHWQKHRQ